MPLIAAALMIHLLAVAATPVVVVMSPTPIALNSE